MELTPKLLEDKFGIVIKSTFVPYSKSRSFKPDAKMSDKNLNWVVTLWQKSGVDNQNERAILSTDYMAGQAHCPSYKQGSSWTLNYAATIDFEVENGHSAKSPRYNYQSAKLDAVKGTAILPNPLDVLSCLFLDSSVLDYSTYEDWAGDFGYDTDSRKWEAIYKECLSIALKLRNGLGDKVLTELKELFQDY